MSELVVECEVWPPGNVSYPDLCELSCPAALLFGQRMGVGQNSL